MGFGTISSAKSLVVPAPNCNCKVADPLFKLLLLINLETNRLGTFFNLKSEGTWPDSFVVLGSGPKGFVFCIVSNTVSWAR